METGAVKHLKRCETDFEDIKALLRRKDLLSTQMRVLSSLLRSHTDGQAQHELNTKTDGEPAHTPFKTQRSRTEVRALAPRFRNKFFQTKGALVAPLAFEGKTLTHPTHPVSRRGSLSSLRKRSTVKCGLLKRSRRGYAVQWPS